MPIFNWDGNGEPVVRSGFGYYWAAAVFLTILILVSWTLGMMLPWKSWVLKLQRNGTTKVRDMELIEEWNPVKRLLEHNCGFAIFLFFWVWRIFLFCSLQWISTSWFLFPCFLDLLKATLWILIFVFDDFLVEKFSSDIWIQLRETCCFTWEWYDDQ